MKKSKPELLQHQREGVDFLSERKAAGLFDDPGLGKTRQLIESIDREIPAGTLKGALIICPNSLKTTWGEEIEKYSTARYAIFGSGRKARRDAFRSLAAAFYVINYEAVVAELPSLRALLRFKPIALVLDESHRIKTPGARITQAVHELRGEAARRYILTGTPVANKPEDLWSQIYFLDDGATLGESFEDFRAKYCAPNGGYVRLDDLRNRLDHLALRRKKEGTISLPPKTYTRLSIPLAGRQAALYEEMRNELIIWVKSMSGEEVSKEGEAILARLTRLAQLASNPELLDASYAEVPAKFQALDELLAQYLSAEGEKVIVWTSFVGNIRSMMSRYEGFSPVCLHGEMDRPGRDRAVRLFRDERSVRLLIANPAAAREGLTLTTARRAIYLDRTFSLVDYLQSQDRIHRISQERPCEIVLLLARGSIDEFVDYSIAQKQRLAAYTQGDTSSIAPADLLLRKPEVLRALLAPDH
jgi:SWI/SNF-related matrix-associated actin-dependent regulator of chromatin subfamily A-like protein 1